jgi:hypothetical protein
MAKIYQQKKFVGTKGSRVQGNFDVSRILETSKDSRWWRRSAGLV